MLAESAAAVRPQARPGWISGPGAVLAILGVPALRNRLNATLVTLIVAGWLLLGRAARNLDHLSGGTPP